MLLNFTDAKTKNPIAVNPSHVVAVFIVPNTPDETGAFNPDANKTVIGVLNGNILVDESFVEVVGQLQGQFK